MNQIKNRRIKNTPFVKARSFITGSLIFLLPVLAIGALVINIKLQKIECRSQLGSCNEILSKKLESLTGKNYLKSKKLLKILLSEDTSVQKYSFQYVPLSSIKLTVIEREPKFAITDAENSYLGLVDKDGYALKLTDSTDLPRLITNEKTIKLGHKVSNEELFSLNLLSDMSAKFQTKEGILTDEGLVVELPGGLKVIFPLSGDSQVLMGALILIYNDLTDPNGSKLNTKGKNIGTIDLRFKNPVLN